VNALVQQLLVFFRRYPFVIASSAIAILLWVANYFVWEDHKQLATNHQAEQRKGEDMLQSLTNHGRITTELAAVKEALAFIDQHLVNEGDLPENMGYFYQIEAASRLRLQALNQLSSMPAPAEQAYKTVPFTLRTTGSYRQVMRFLRELESGPRIFKVQTYSMTQSGSGPAAANDAPAQVSLDLTIEVLAHP
jgi:Tfp pilus assembly protein PilO